MFSKKGDKKVSVDKRINLVKNIAQISSSSSNARLNFLFACNYEKNGENNYLGLKDF
jgi:hypothetical protein